MKLHSLLNTSKSLVALCVALPVAASAQTYTLDDEKNFSQTAFLWALKQIYHQGTPLDEDPWIYIYDSNNKLIHKELKANRPDHSRTYLYDPHGKVVNPTVNGLRSNISSWSPGLCLDYPVASNTGVWIEDQPVAKRVNGDLYGLNRHRTSYNQYVVSENTPYEIASKNYARAGVKRFYKYYHSFRIDSYDYSNGLGLSDLPDKTTYIENKSKHDYDITHTFKKPGSTSWINSLTINNFSIGIQVSSGDVDFNYPPSSWSFNYSLIQKGKYVIGDCGFAQVKVEANTRPTINGFSVTTPPATNNPIDGYQVYLEPHAQLDANNVIDKHTPSQNLSYVWETTHRSGKKSMAYGKKASVSEGVIAFPGLGYKHHDPVTKIRLIVSDGDLSTVSERNR